MIEENHYNDQHISSIKLEVKSLNRNIHEKIRKTLHMIVKASGENLTEQFYRTMMEQPQARFFLDQETVSNRLQSSLQRWLSELFAPDTLDIERFCNWQMEIGAVHARIQVPVHLVMRGVRELKHGIVAQIKMTRLSVDEIADAIHYTSTFLDLAFSLMTAAYIQASERATRSDEAFRLFTLGQDLMTERERQRAALSEWAQTLFFETQAAAGGAGVAHLSKSEFGLWFFHRGSVLFERTPEFQSVVEHITHLDRLTDDITRATQTSEHLERLRSARTLVAQIGALLSMLFDRSLETDQARDPLTKLFQRRFLLTALSRTIDIQKNGRHPFSVILTEIDDIQKIHSEFGDAGTDSVIQHSATLLLNFMSGGDSVFRMGQASFLIIRAGANFEQATRLADLLAERYANSHPTIHGRALFDHKMNMAVAEYDGHPDPRRLLVRVENILREKKRL